MLIPRYNWLLSTLISCLIAEPALATSLTSASDVENLCRTATSEEHSVSPFDQTGVDPTGVDPLLEVLEQRDYTTTRGHRILDVYSVTLSMNEFRFLPGDPGVLTIDTLNTFSIIGGAIELDLGTAAEVSFVMPDARCDEVRTECATDQVRLRIHFHLRSQDNPSHAYCERNSEGTPRILGRLLLAELVSRWDDTVLASYESPRLSRQPGREGLGAGELPPPFRPSVIILNTVFPTTQPPELEAQLLLAEAQLRLTRCYVRAITMSGRIQGAAVMTYHVDREGVVWDPVITVDHIDQELVTGCAVSEMAGVLLPRLNPGAVFQVRLTIVFRLE